MERDADLLQCRDRLGSGHRAEALDDHARDLRVIDGLADAPAEFFGILAGEATACERPNLCQIGVHRPVDHVVGGCGVVDQVRPASRQDAGAQGVASQSRLAGAQRAHKGENGFVGQKNLRTDVSSTHWNAQRAEQPPLRINQN